MQATVRAVLRVCMCFCVFMRPHAECVRVRERNAIVPEKSLEARLFYRGDLFLGFPKVNH